MSGKTTEKQLDFGDEYDWFVEKFKPKKTTDDCYTPRYIYDAVCDYVCRRFGCDRESIVRPFWPGEDYERREYPPGCLVLDNPPFSIFTKIVRFYCSNGIRFFLFGPGLTIFGSPTKGVSFLITGNSITYENGATVPTGFCHNLLDDASAESCPELRKIIDEADTQNRKALKKKARKLALPCEIITAANLQYMAHHGIAWRFALSTEAVFVRKLDNLPSGIFGGGFLLSERVAAERATAERATAERAAAERITLSEREKEIQRLLSRKAAEAES